MNEQTEAELKLTIELLETRRQLIEANAQVMQYQHAEIGAQIEAVQAQLTALNSERDRNRS